MRHLRFILFAAAILGLRFYHLEAKPLHHDESINGWFLLQMWNEGYFKYDPSNYHGPLYFYLLQIFEVLFGEGLWILRAVPAFFSSLTAIYFLRRGGVWTWGAAVLALSPAAEFFGRSGIHEGILVFFLLVCLGALEQGFEKITSKQIFVFAGALTACMALKETTSIFVLSGVISWLLIRPRGFERIHEHFPALRAALFWSLLATLLLFTGFLQDLAGIVDFFAAYLPWLKTGVGGGGHDKSFFYWAELLIRNEWGTCFLAAVSLLSFKSASPKLRFFSLWAWLHLLIFSLIPYKTPWCLISIQIPLIFAGILSLAERPRWQLLTGVFALCNLLVFWNLNFATPLQLQHPYVYVQTDLQFKKVLDSLQANRDLIQNHKILVATDERWPLPWALRNDPVTYQFPADEMSRDFDFIIVDLSQAESWAEFLKGQFHRHDFLTRDSREPAVLWVREEIWQQMGEKP